MEAEGLAGNDVESGWRAIHEYTNRGMLGGWRDGGIRNLCGARFGVRWVMSAIFPTYLLGRIHNP
jgi:hypothetical protein